MRMTQRLNFLKTENDARRWAHVRFLWVWICLELKSMYLEILILFFFFIAEAIGNCSGFTFRAYLCLFLPSSLFQGSLEITQSLEDEALLDAPLISSHTLYSQLRPRFHAIPVVLLANFLLLLHVSLRNMTSLWKCIIFILKCYPLCKQKSHSNAMAHLFREWKSHFK